MPTPKDLPDVGGFIRDLRRNAKISLRQLADQAGVSNPYLSQIERGLRKPSAEVLQQLASALRVSTPAMYLRAGLLDDRDGQGVLAAIAADPDLTMAQRQSLSQIYETFRRENLRIAETTAAADATGPATGSTGSTADAARSATDATGADPAPVSTPASGPAPTDPPAAGQDQPPAAGQDQPAAAGQDRPVVARSVVESAAAAVTPTEAVIESVAVTEAGAAAAPNQNPKPVKKTARKAVRRTATAAEEEKS